MIIQKKKRRFIPTLAQKDIIYAVYVISVGFFAGIANGFLGTGGGILLLLILGGAVGAEGYDKRDAFATALFCMVPLSLLSLFLTRGGALGKAILSPDYLPLYLGGAVGGLLGAYLLSRLRLPLIEAIFAALLIFSGWRMLS